MIIDVIKYLIVGSKEDLDSFFKRAQKAGFIEFIRPSKRRKVDYPEAVTELMKAAKLLKKFPEEQKKPHEKRPTEIAREALDLENQINLLEESVRLHSAEIARITPFGDFDFDEIKELEERTGRHFQFFCMKSAKTEKVTVPGELIYVATEYDMDYFISFEVERVRFPGAIEMHLDHSLSQLKEMRSSALIRQKECEKRLHSLGAYLDFVRDDLVKHLNRAQLLAAKGSAVNHLDEQLFSIECYMPKNKAPHLVPLLDNLAIHFEEIAVEDNERVPTYMENSGFTKVGEDLVHIYDTPAVTDTDPSRYVFWAFLIFFAMIVSDAGYGFIYLALALFLRWKLRGAKPSIKRFLTLMTALGTSCVIWGVLTSSYFGLALGPENPITHFSITYHLSEKKTAYHMEQNDDVYQEWLVSIPKLQDATTADEFLEKGTKIIEGKEQHVVLDRFTDNLLMEFSLLAGIIHLLISLTRYMRRNWANLGWIIFMCGGYLYFPKMLNATTMANFLGLIDKTSAAELGGQLIFGGLLFSVITALIQHRVRGLMEITNVVQIFSDVLSYLRLYALGLAGMIMAATFNDVSASVNFLIAPLLLIAGHASNMVLGIMGGVIHGLRLNFLEWYHYSFDGDGRQFNPLKLLKSRSNL